MADEDTPRLADDICRANVQGKPKYDTVRNRALTR